MKSNKTTRIYIRFILYIISLKFLLLNEVMEIIIIMKIRQKLLRKIYNNNNNKIIKRIMILWEQQKVC